MKKFAVALVALTLSACGSSRADGELDPGKWKMTATIRAIDAPGAPEAVLKFMQTMVGKPQSTDKCMTPEQAKVGVKNLASQMQKGDCSTDAFKAAGGKISGNITCKMAGRDLTTALDGTYEPAKIAMKIDMETAHPAPPSGKAMIHMDVTAERVGDCDK